MSLTNSVFPLLLDHNVSLSAAWTTLRHATTEKGLTTACEPLWDWLCVVGVTENADMLVGVLLPVNGDQGF